MLIRRADILDVPSFGQLINDSAEYGLMLHRSPSYLYENVRDFYVAEDDSKIVGVCGLKVVWANLAEVYSLVVDSSQRGKGVGKKLVMACVEDAKQLKVAKLMTLTYEDVFFGKCGFEVIDRQQLPLKVWSECLHCAKREACDEIAMVLTIDDSPAAESPALGRPLAGTIEIPAYSPADKQGDKTKRAKMDEAT